MMTVIPKWRVLVTMPNGKQAEFWISDNYIGNVLRQVAAMHFSADGLHEPTSIHVGSDPGGAPR